MASLPLPLTWEDILQALERLRGVAHRTPVFISRQFNETAGCSVYFKAENLQRGGAFKFRGAYNKIRAEMEKGSVKSVVAYSSGNHAQAVALTAKLLEIPSTIVMPSDAPEAKILATRAYGADVIFYDRFKENREEIGNRISRERNALLVPPFDDYLVMAGQGTAAVELLEEVPHLDFLLTPASGAGLLAGTCVAARYLRPRIGIYGVEPEDGNDTYLSLQKGERVEIPVPHTIADGLRTQAPGKLTFPIIKELADGILLVNDDELIQVLTFLLERMKILVEPSGAAAAAAVHFKKADFEGKRVGVILSGGNVDMDRLRSYLATPPKLT
ncbi:pyridoxal-phosphate dependent enzyme [bacterium]|nr:pyridoxal-phosphate dependent enzyme [bacterium]MCI0606694.1 pyridoxal-phosphate dependent enzyme [bacterium]